MQFSRLFKVKTGKLGVLKNWLTILNSERKAEALATFAYENISRETFIIFAGNDGEDYVIGFNEVDEGKEKKSGDKNIKINQEHLKIFEDCLEPISKAGEIVLDLKL